MIEDNNYLLIGLEGNKSIEFLNNLMWFTIRSGDPCSPEVINLRYINDLLSVMISLNRFLF